MNIFNSHNIFDMHRNTKYVRGRSRNKGSNKKRFRDLSADTFYKNKNYNKLTRQHGITPFRWNKYCNYANRIYRQLDAKLTLQEDLKNLT